MSFAVTHLAILAALHFIVELLRWAASVRIRAAEVAGDIEGEVKTEAAVSIPVLEVVFFSAVPWAVPCRSGQPLLCTTFGLALCWCTYSEFIFDAMVIHCSSYCRRLCVLLLDCFSMALSGLQLTLTDTPGGRHSADTQLTLTDTPGGRRRFDVAMWGVFAVLASTIHTSRKVLSLALKFALELVVLLIFGTDFEVESAKFNMYQGHVEIRIADGVDLNFVQGRDLGLSNVNAMLGYMEADLTRASVQAQVVPQSAIDVNDIGGSSAPSDVQPRLGHVKLDDINVAVLRITSPCHWYQCMSRWKQFTKHAGGVRNIRTGKEYHCGVLYFLMHVMVSVGVIVFPTWLVDLISLWDPVSSMLDS
eukprot:4557721-Amphidinium_carterae.1